MLHMMPLISVARVFTAAQRARTNAGVRMGGSNAIGRLLMHLASQLLLLCHSCCCRGRVIQLLPQLLHFTQIDELRRVTLW